MSLLPGSNFSSASSLAANPQLPQALLSGGNGGAGNNHAAGSPGVSTESSALPVNSGGSGGSGSGEVESSADSGTAFAVCRSWTVDAAPKAASCISAKSDSEPSSDDTMGDSECGRRAMLGLAMSSTSVRAQLYVAVCSGVSLSLHDQFFACVSVRTQLHRRRLLFLLLREVAMAVLLVTHTRGPFELPALRGLLAALSKQQKQAAVKIHGRHSARATVC
jgi:hypothetical protein